MVVTMSQFVYMILRKGCVFPRAAFVKKAQAVEWLRLHGIDDDCLARYRIEDPDKANPEYTVMDE